MFNFFNWRPPASTSAPVARERLQILLAHERRSGSPGNHSELVKKLKEEILAVIARHMEIDRDKVVVTMDRAEDVSTLEIDIELPLHPEDVAPKAEDVTPRAEGAPPKAGYLPPTPGDAPQQHGTQP